MSRKISIIIAMVFTVVLSVSTFFIIRNHIDSAKQNEVHDNLAEIVEDEPPKENEGVTFSEDKDYLAEYLELYKAKKESGLKEKTIKRNLLDEDRYEEIRKIYLSQTSSTPKEAKKEFDETLELPSLKD